MAQLINGPRGSPGGLPLPCNRKRGIWRGEKTAGKRSLFGRAPRSAGMRSGPVGRTRGIASPEGGANPRTTRIGLGPEGSGPKGGCARSRVNRSDPALRAATLPNGARPRGARGPLHAENFYKHTFH